MEIKVRKTTSKVHNAENLGETRVSIGTMDESQIPKHNNKYITGLDRYTPRIKSIQDEKVRDAEIKKLDAKRKDLEIKLGVSLDQDTLEGNEFFKNLIINFTELQFLNETANPMDELLSIIIRENSLSRNFPVALDKTELGGDIIKSKDYYIADDKADLNISVSRKMNFSRAVGMLTDLVTNDALKLNMIATIILPKVIPITSKTDPQYIFDKMYEFLESGVEGSNSSSTKNVQDFLEIVTITKEELTTKFYLEKALRYNIIVKNNTSGEYYNRLFPEYRYGKTMEDMYNHFTTPSNQEEFGTNSKKDASFSIIYLVNQKEL